MLQLQSMQHMGRAEGMIQHRMARIRGGESGPGDRLPSEWLLQGELGVGQGQEGILALGGEDLSVGLARARPVSISRCYVGGSPMCKRTRLGVVVVMVAMMASLSWATVVPISFDAGDPNVRPYNLVSITVGDYTVYADGGLVMGTTNFVKAVADPNDPNVVVIEKTACPENDDLDLNTELNWQLGQEFETLFDFLWTNTNGDANDFFLFDMGADSGDHPKLAPIFADGSLGAAMEIPTGAAKWGKSGYFRNAADANDAITARGPSGDANGQAIGGLAFAITDLLDVNGVALTNDAVIKGVKITNRGGVDPVGFFAVAPPAYLAGLADVNVVGDAIVSLRYKGTEYVVADGDLTLGITTRWYIDANGVETLWADGAPAPAATVSGTSNPKTGDVGSRADNFLFAIGGASDISSIDGINFQETIFAVPSNTFFIFERGGNDAGSMQAILADGSLGQAVALNTAAKGGPYAKTPFKAAGSDAYGVVFKTNVPVIGVRINASGFDTLSISIPTP